MWPLEAECLAIAPHIDGFGTPNRMPRDDWVRGSSPKYSKMKNHLRLVEVAFCRVRDSDSCSKQWRRPLEFHFFSQRMDASSLVSDVPNHHQRSLGRCTKARPLQGVETVGCRRHGSLVRFSGVCTCHDEIKKETCKICATYFLNGIGFVWFCHVLSMAGC